MTEDIGIATSVCHKLGHEYVSSCTQFARDRQGLAFKGDGADRAAKHQVWVCRKCGSCLEVCIIPKLELKNPRLPMPSQKFAAT